MAIVHLDHHGWFERDATVQAAPRRAADAPKAVTQARFERGMARFESGQWAQAFAELSALANRGHPAAARLSMMLVRRGAALFGGSFCASDQEQRRWRQLGE
jgi:hypothetical protein